jgi:hypothetical protein
MMSNRLQDTIAKRKLIYRTTLYIITANHQLNSNPFLFLHFIELCESVTNYLVRLNV